MTNVTMTDPELGVVVMNETDFDTGTVRDALFGQHPEVAALIRWTVQTQGDLGRGREGGIFARDRFVTPEQIFAQFQVAQDAVANDDVVATVMASTESLAFARMSFTSEDANEEDVWNQIAYDIDLDSRIREMWQELFTISQFYAVTWWGRKSYTVRGKTKSGVKHRKSYEDIVVPLGVTLLDPLKVVAVGNLMFNQEQLCYIADRTEVDLLDGAVLNDPDADPISRQIIIAKYAPPDYERRNMAKLGINADWLYILNPRNVWRHTLTRAQYRRFAGVRMTSIFELLDLKHQLRQKDRAELIGATNFILLVRKGTDHLPAKPLEVTNLQAQVKTLARVPVLVGDHRLSVEIVQPKTDFTLSAEKYSTIDSRITSRLYQMFMVHGGSGSVRSDDSLKVGKVIARGLESRRFMLRRTVERQIVGPCVAANDGLTVVPKLQFHPTRIELDFDPAMTQLLIDLRDRGDVSRDTTLNQLDFDQEDESIKRQREAEVYDKVFVPTNVPFSGPSGGGAGQGGQPAAPGDQSGSSTRTPPHSHGPDGTPVPLPKSNTPAKKPTTPVKADPRTAGRNQGGTRNGGGAAPGSGQGQAPRRGRPASK